jgi:prepilin-type N-terminal cleavage/methylation domain-containing protein
MIQRSSKRNAFTLIELLVVITIIGVLAGFAVPAINGALERAKQTSDVANARQLGIVLFQIANDENGVYPTGPRDDNTGKRPANPSGTSTALFNDMLKNKELSDPKILATNNRTPYTGSLTNPDLKATNVGWDYLGGASTTSDSSLPLIISAKAVTSLDGLKSEITLPEATGQTGPPWGKKGMVIYTIGQSASFLKARAGGKVTAPVSSDVDVASMVLMEAK